MRLGAVFPQTEIGTDPGGVRAYAEAVEGLGFDHLMAYDHVLGADRARHPDLVGPYRAEDLFHEILVLFGYVAAIGVDLGLREDRAELHDLCTREPPTIASRSENRTQALPLPS